MMRTDKQIWMWGDGGVPGCGCRRVVGGGGRADIERG